MGTAFMMTGMGHMVGLEQVVAFQRRSGGALQASLLARSQLAVFAQRHAGHFSLRERWEELTRLAKLLPAPMGSTSCMRVLC